NIDPGWMNVRPEIKAYAVPYIWGTIGIAYRKDLIKKKLDSWMDLFKPETRLRGKIVMINDSKDIVGAGLKALGYSLNSETLSQYDEVRTLLHAQKPYVFDYSYVVLNKNSALIKGDIWMAMVYNGDGLVLQEQDPRISFVAPREGTNLWVDYLVILKHAKNKVLAAQFINFLNEPENAAQLSEYLMFATPNKSAMAHISAEYKNNKMIYPDEKILKKSEVYKILSPRVEKFRHIIFAEVAN
ncbi:MAG: spermidine/putrescine ABC transporter substrate-binding protein, partial [Desulfobacteraceae bacterium]|nr:spermidine/putrescine ABC transporter substrate-binding protein [Desulfobacteraceae bacterium]